MTISGATSTESSAWDSDVQSVAPTIGWFLRRSALWAAIVLAAVVFACALYALATDVGASGVRGQPSAMAEPLKI